MADLEFNTTVGQTIDRELLIAYLNTGTASAPVWSAIGKRVEDSSEEMDWSTDTKQDILGHTFTTMKKPTITQTFDPIPLDAGDAAAVKMWNLAVKDQDAQALANQDTSTPPAARRCLRSATTLALLPSPASAARAAEP